MIKQEPIDMCLDISEKQLRFTLNPDAVWEEFDVKLKLLIDKTEWQEVKFLDDSYKGLHSSMRNLPNKKGGVYVFVLKPEIIPATHLYILYIGRARYTSNQNLRKRCRQYFSDNKRPKINRMKTTWGNHLYIRYLPLEDNNIIDEMEKALINAILPPCNDEIPSKRLMRSIKAFA